jgi:NAD(P)-dependent dehydrogenase (short-subunit alcohol dehydrogenase family)
MTGNRVWLITGAGRGLGLDIAKAVLATGQTVVATGRDAAKVAAFATRSRHCCSAR